uniref:Uncharacterized protein n=1 Tax=Plectus sambesii TaxID=2011161 RepID=A0A914VUF4_9BILA
MGELMLEPPEDFATRAPQPEMNVDPGWLVRVRKNRYLDSVEEAATLKRAASVDHLRQRRPSSGRDHLSPERPSSAASLVSPNSLAAQREDFYSWKLKKELELAKYMQELRSFVAVVCYRGQLSSSSPITPRALAFCWCSSEKTGRLLED